MTTKIERSDYLAAIARLNEKGFAKQMFNASDGRSCALGHLVAVKGLKTEMAGSAGIAVCDGMGFSFTEVTEFNDDHDTSQQDVETFFAFGAAGAFEKLRSPSV